MTRAQRRTIEKEFYNYEKMRNECAAFMAERALANMGVDYSGDKVKTSQVNNAEEKLVKTIDEYERMYKWCLVYEKTLERFKWTLKDKMMQMRYIDKNHDVCICDQIGIERRAYYYWVNEVLEIAFLWAQEYDLM